MFLCPEKKLLKKFWQMIWSKKFVSKKTFWSKEIQVKKMFVFKKSWSKKFQLKIISVSRKFLGQKILVSRKFLGPNNFWVKKIVDPKFWVKKMFSLKNYLHGDNCNQDKCCMCKFLHGTYSKILSLLLKSVCQITYKQ